VFESLPPFSSFPDAKTSIFPSGCQAARGLPPGRPGGLPPQGSHRSVLAQLTHTAPHLMHTLPWRRLVVTLTQRPASMDRPCFPPKLHETLPPSLPRVPSGRFPWISGTTRRSDFLTVFSPHFVSFAWRYLGTPAFRPRSAADAWPTDRPGVCCTGCSWSGLLQGTVRISQVPGEPVDHSPCSSDPGVTRHACGSRCS
jgi:hypothetical protein